MLAFSNIVLCSLGALVLTAQAGSTRNGLALWLAGLVIGGLLFATTAGALPIAVEAQQGALLIFLLALFLLVMPGRIQAFMPAGGVLAVLWAEALQVQGLLPWMSWLLVAPSLAAAMYCGRTVATFCPPALLQEILVVLLIAASVTALVPGVVDGWSTAQGMSAADGDASTYPDPSSALVMPAICFVCGAAYALFKTLFINRWKSL